jgi:hypothetical protein
MCSCSREVSFSIFGEFVAKKVLLNRFRFVCGMGFNNLGCVDMGGGGGLANMMLLGRDNETGKWSEFC